MSRENVDLVRSVCAAWERGDYSSAEWAHPDIEFVLADVPDPGSWRGVAEMADAWRAFLGAWEEHRVEVEGYHELDGERVLVLGRLVAHGRASGVDVSPMSARAANLFHIRDGKVTRLVNYFDRDRALAELGLAQESLSGE